MPLARPLRPSPWDMVMDTTTKPRSARAARRARLARQARLARAEGVLLDVTALNGATMIAVNRAGTPFTVTVSTTTTILEAGSPISITAIMPDSFIRVRGPRTSTDTVAARRIIIAVPAHSGKVSAINGTTLILTGAFGKSYTVNTTPTTTYVYFRHPKKIAAFSSIVVGSRVTTQGPLSADKTTLTALRVVILPAAPGKPAVNATTSTMGA